MVVDAVMRLGTPIGGVLSADLGISFNDMLLRGVSRLSVLRNDLAPWS